MILEWFTPTRKPSFEWFGQTGKTLAMIEAGEISVVASVMGPPGGRGPAGADSMVPGPASTVPGPAGAGVPVGGITGQVLTKASVADYATAWTDPAGSSSVDWDDVTGKPDLFDGAYSSLSGLPTTVDNTLARFDGTSGTLQGSVVTVLDSGNMGFGTSTPSAKIDIVGGIIQITNNVDNTPVVGLRFVNTGGGVATGSKIQFPYGHITSFYAGTEFQCSANPLDKLTIASGNFAFSGNYFSFSSGQNSDVTFFNGASSGYSTIFQGPGDIIFNTYSGAFTDKVTIKQGGNLGVGTSAPSEKLEVVGNGKFSGSVTVADDPYDATAWNGSLEVPTKNAIRDKIEATPKIFIQATDPAVAGAYAWWDTSGGNLTLWIEDGI